MEDDELGPVTLTRTKSWKEYEVRDEIPLILNEGLLPIKFQGDDYQDLDFEGALRFYFVANQQSELTKAVRLTNKTSVKDLIPILIEKFSLHDENDYELYEHTDKDEVVLLSLDECPLARAISTKEVPRFVLKSKSEDLNLEIEERDKKDKKKRLFSLGIVGGASRKDTEKKKSKSEGTKKPEKDKKSKKKKKNKNFSINPEVSYSDDEILSDEVGEEHFVNENNNIDDVDASSGYAKLKKDIGPERPSSPPSSDSIEPVIISSVVVDQEFSLPDTLSEIPQIGTLNIRDSDNDSAVVPAEIEDLENTQSNLKGVYGFYETINFAPIERNLKSAGEQLVTQDVQNRKLSFSNSSIFFEQDNVPPQLDVKKNKKNDKKTKKEKTNKKVEKNKVIPDKRSKSFPSMLKGQKKKILDKDGQTELSTNKLTPGILKVFGDHVSKGSNYKAVRASTISSAQEVVRMALEKYGLDNENSKDYVLCDVVGQFSVIDGKATPKLSKVGGKNRKGEKPATEEEQPQWNTEYVRAVHDNEKPLVLQSLWKPTNGRSRRFELRRRVDVESSCFFINTADTNGRRPSETSIFDDSDQSSVVSGDINPSVEHKDCAAIVTSSHSKDVKITGRDVKDDSSIAPQFAPYFMLVHGYQNKMDKIFHKLDDPTVLVGPHMENDSRSCKITLYSSDILLPHCWIYKKVKLEGDSTETNLDEINFLIFIEPANGADITVNGMPISTTTLIKSGQLITFGKHYVYIFNDPTQKYITTPLPWVEQLKQSFDSSVTSTIPVSGPQNAIDLHVYKPAVTEDKSIQVESIQQVFSDYTEESDDVSDESEDEATSLVKYQATRKQVEKSRLQLVYDINDEEELLHTIIDIANDELGNFKLTPAYFFMMTIEHSAAAFTEIQTRKLLLKISSGLQGIAWEKTKEIGKQSSIKENDPLKLLNRILPELKPVLLWMASSLEMLHYLQCNISNYLLTKDKVATSKEGLLNADEELLTVLEEVIMFTFQQTVYHLTKVLYVALPSIVDVNPFQSEEAENEDAYNKSKSPIHPNIDKIKKVFSSVLDAANEYQVHPQIVSQLFAYLFFFSNASLFNSLMERGPGGNFFRWAKGAQIRANLDVFDEWARANGLGSQFEQYMARFVNAVDLLALPKIQLLQLEWRQMRMDYPVLNPAQLQQLLAEYQLGDKPRPRAWYPPPEEVEPALRSSEILESFATHPPLMLPSSNFVMDLNKDPDSKEFSKYLQLIKKKFDPNMNNEKEVIHEEATAIVEAVAESIPDNFNSNERILQTKRTKSNIDMEYVESAKQHAERQRIDSKSSGTSPTHVASIKSITVQPKKTTITVTSKKIESPTDEISNGVNAKQQNGVDDLIKQARILINANDVTSDDDEDTDKQLSGDLNDDDDVFVVELQRSEKGLGLGLIDGMFTSLKNNGIYVRTIVPNTPASKDPRLHIGDQILAVNGTSLVGSDYSHAMELIKKAGMKLSFLLAKSDEDTRNSILTAST